MAIERRPRPKGPLETECDACGYETACVAYRPMDHVAARQGREGDDDRGFFDWLCHFCANTSAGQALAYPEQYKGSKAILTSMSWLANWFADGMGWPRPAEREGGDPSPKP